MAVAAAAVAVGGGWVWVFAPTPSGGGWNVVGSQAGASNVTPPPFPQYVPPPVYGDDHQQVRLVIDQRVMLEGEGFRAALALDNTSALPLDVVSVDLEITDVLSGTEQSASFVITPTLPTDLGPVPAGRSASGEWLLLPSRLLARPASGTQFNVKAVITYTWEGATYAIATAPELITVLPTPDLEITYELPLETVPCTAFMLKAIFENKGQGAARNLRFSSAQPRLLDPATSLPINFMITQTFVDGEDKGATLALDLGDLAPGGTDRGGVYAAGQPPRQVYRVYLGLPAGQLPGHAAASR